MHTRYLCSEDVSIKFGASLLCIAAVLVGYIPSLNFFCKSPQQQRTKPTINAITKKRYMVQEIEAFAVIYYAK
jgi:hypothetical protein